MQPVQPFIRRLERPHRLHICMHRASHQVKLRQVTRRIDLDLYVAEPAVEKARIEALHALSLQAVLDNRIPEVVPPKPMAAAKVQ